MWRYVQRTGALYAPDGERAGVGYSGHGDGLNNPDEQSVKQTGPLPCDDYTIGAAECVEVAGPHGKFVLRLTADHPRDDFGRDGFLMHGDRKDAEENPHQASEGCIVQALVVRERVNASPDKRLRVVADLAAAVRT